MKRQIPVLAKEFGHGDYLAVFYFVEKRTVEKYSCGDFFLGYVTEDVIRCVKVRCSSRNVMAKTLKKFRNARHYLSENETTELLQPYNMLWLANRWTVCYLHDGKHHNRYIFKPNGAEETPWWITE